MSDIDEVDVRLIRLQHEVHIKEEMALMQRIAALEHLIFRITSPAGLSDQERAEIAQIHEREKERA